MFMLELKKQLHTLRKGDKQADITQQSIEVELHDALMALELLSLMRSYYPFLGDGNEHTLDLCGR